MSSFEYHAATSVEDAATQLAGNADAAILAGGMSIIPTIKLGLAAPSALVDLNRVGGLGDISVDGDAVVIGATARHDNVATSDEVRSRIPALAALAAGIGDPQVRNRGTIGGSLAHNDPAADYPAACLALGATIVTNRREIAAEDYFTGFFETALEDGELITSVRFPIPEKAAYMKFPHPATRFALVGVFVAKMSDGVRVAVTGAGQGGVFRASDMEAALSANFAPEALDGISVSPGGLASDIHADAEYRAHLIGVMAQRAVAASG